MDNEERDIAKSIAEIDFNYNLERIQDTYFAKYGAKSEKETEELDKTIADSMRKYKILFYADKFILQNIIKNESTSHFYNETYEIEKVENGYIFFITKQMFYFFKFTDFNSDELRNLDRVLEKYYKKTEGRVIAKVENYELTEKRCIQGFKYLYKNLDWFYITVSLFLVIILYKAYNNIFIALTRGILFYFVLIILAKTLYYKVMAKKIIKSMNEKFKRARVIFYEDKAEIILKEKLGLTSLEYREFYKIKKMKKGYIFCTGRYSFYFFWFDDFKEDELIRLEKVLLKYLK